MRSPARNIAGHLMWTRSGSVWALWRLEPLPYGYRPAKDKAEARVLHQALFRSLPGESLVLGLCAGLEPAAVVERMIDGVDLARCPDWAAECVATLDTLDQIGIGQRIYWLAVPLSDPSGRDRAKESITAAFADLRDALGLPRAGLTQREVDRRMEQARKVEAMIPAPFRPVPATAAQMVWLHLHAQERGLFADMAVPQSHSDITDQLLTPRSGAALTDPLLDEGGQSDLDRRQLRNWNPLERRYLKVAQPHAVPGTTTASYQSLLVLADVPDEGMLFPGSEFLGRVDESGLEVDWALRLTVRSSQQVAKENRRALNNLNEQFGQREGELSHGLNTLERAASDLAEYAALLDSDKLEVEAQATVVFAVAGPTPTAAADDARKLTSYFNDAGYRLAQPLGYQELLWWAMLPGAPSNKAVREFAQITTSKALSAAVPLASTELGDSRGSLLGVNISGGRTGVVLHDIAGASLRDVSGSIGIAGELGSGKSLLQKKLAGDVVDRGGQIVVPDRTAMGEWAFWASSVTDAVVVDIADPAVSLDPLRMYGRVTGSRITQSFLTPLLNVAPASDRGALLAEVLAAEYLARHELTGLGDLVAHLESSCSLAGAGDLARLMRVFARRDFGRVVFDNSLPPLTHDAPAVIIRTHTLELPNREELEVEHLFNQMRLEKVFGRACYALIAGLARQMCFTDRSRLGLFVVDEAHHLTSSPEGEREISDFVRDGRKHQAAVILGSHDPEADFGSDTLRGLIPTRIQMRQRDRTLAKKGLRWLDMDPDDEGLLEMLISDTSPIGPEAVDEWRRGEAFIRDSSGNIGRIKVLAPSLPTRNEAVRTSPPPSRSEP
ncbi:ATP-binding protein [Nocardioides limicola]|uniref:ATP-binding protein n=1 Tax=Nocardioides limicola TaxID=2803368 RepID=UPI00193BB5E8|nr:ATP-binding protein [Nocardioides sp. DJM-14]